MVSSLDHVIKPIDYYTGVDFELNLYALHPRLIKLNEFLKLESSIQIERRISSPALSTYKKALIKIGLFSYLFNLKMFFTKFKILRTYR